MFLNPGKSDILGVDFGEERGYMHSQNPYKFNFNAFTFSMGSAEVFLFCRIQVCIDEEISSCLGSYKEKECDKGMSIHDGYEFYGHRDKGNTLCPGDPLYARWSTWENWHRTC